MFLLPTEAHDAGVAPPLPALCVPDDEPAPEPELELELVVPFEPLEVVEVLLPHPAAPVNSSARASSSGSGRKNLLRREGHRAGQDRSGQD